MSDEHLVKYVRYIRNTSLVPLPVEVFDEDWEPIGPHVRADLVRAGLVTEVAGGLRLASSQEATRPTGLHFFPDSHTYELWAYGERACVYTEQFMAQAAGGIPDSIRAAAAEPDEELRDLKCAGVTLPGMELTGTWKWLPVKYGTAVRVAVIPTVPRRRVELRPAQLGALQFYLAPVPEMRTVFYRLPERLIPVTVQP
jgi:hypothetical protein